MCYCLTKIIYVMVGYMKKQIDCMTDIQIMKIVQAQLSVDLNCTPDDLSKEKDRFVFCEAKENIGRRPFPRAESHFEMLSMGKSIIVSATSDLLPFVKKQINGKSRDDAFSLPFVHGHSMYYLPDIYNIEPLPMPDGFEYEMIERSGMQEIYEIKGFKDAVCYDPNHPRPDALVALARKGNVVVGMAGASADCATMWQIGIDVLPEYRNFGLAAALVNSLTLETLKRGYVPYYGTASSNIASQKVAHRSGFMPAWMCVYQGIFGNCKTLPTN